MKIRKLFLLGVMTLFFVGIYSIGPATTFGEPDSIVQLDIPFDVEVPDGSTLVTTSVDGVIYVSSKQICTQRMGCKCKHGWSGNDTLKKHTPEENPYDDQNSWNPHLDIKCTKCNSKWYCPVFHKFRS